MRYPEIYWVRDEELNFKDYIRNAASCFLDIVRSRFVDITRKDLAGAEITKLPPPSLRITKATKNGKNIIGESPGAIAHAYTRTTHTGARAHLCSPPPSLRALPRRHFGAYDLRDRLHSVFSVNDWARDLGERRTEIVVAGKRVGENKNESERERERGGGRRANTASFWTSGCTRSLASLGTKTGIGILESTFAVPIPWQIRSCLPFSPAALSHSLGETPIGFLRSRPTVRFSFFVFFFFVQCATVSESFQSAVSWHG